jgi:hypothetical protein
VKYQAPIEYGSLNTLTLGKSASLTVAIGESTSAESSPPQLVAEPRSTAKSGIVHDALRRPSRVPIPM